MIKFISGVVVGIFLIAISLYLIMPRQAFWYAHNYTRHGFLSVNNSFGLEPEYNYVFGADLTADTEYPHQSKELILVANQPIVSLTPSDIRKVCLQPVWYRTDEHLANFYVQIYLTQSGKNLISKTLKPLEGKHLSFRINGNELNTFVVSPEKLAQFATNEISTKYDGDLNFGVPYTSTYVGLVTAHQIAGDGNLQMCEETDTFDMIPHYQEISDEIWASFKHMDELRKDATERLP